MDFGRKVTTRVIADKLGLSQTTVSQILNATPGQKFAEGTRKKVLKTAERMGYQAGFMRRAIKKPLNNIGFIVDDTFTRPSTFRDAIIHGVSESAREGGYILSICKTPWRLEDSSDAERATRQMIDLLMGRVLDGLLIDKSRFSDVQMRMLEATQSPFVLINGRLPASGRAAHAKAYWVSIDHEQGGRLAVEHLVRLGHRRIGLINPELSGYPRGWLPAWIGDRMAGYRRGLKAAGITPPAGWEVEGSLNDQETAVRAVDRLLAADPEPTAIFVTDDAMAIVVLNYLRRRGWRVPEDISVIGYGGWALNFVADVPLTTIRVPWELMGRLGGELLISLLHQESAAEHVRILLPELVEGRTTGPVNPTASTGQIASSRTPRNDGEEEGTSL